MLPLILVVLAAHSALSVPVYNGEQVNVNALPIESVPRPNYNTPGGIIDALFERVDGGERSMYQYLLEYNIKDLDNNNNPAGQFLAYLQALAVMGEWVTPSSSSANICDYANVINAYAQYVETGNRGALNQALSTFASVMGQRFQEISAYSRNPDSQRFVTPRAGNCASGGRTYAFETVWGGIISNGAATGLSGALNEQSCTGRRLYNAFRLQSNNIAAAATASAIFGTSATNYQQAISALASFMSNPGSAGAASAAASALMNAV